MKYLKDLTLFDKLAIVATPKEYVLIRQCSINGRKHLKLTFTNDPTQFKYDKDFSKEYQSDELKELINLNKI